MRKRFILFFLTAAVLFSVLPLNCAALEDPVLEYSKSCVVYNVENSKICYSKDENERVAPAGTVKIMTACLAIEYYAGKYDTEITVQSEWFQGVSGHTAGFRSGETVTADDVISALIVGSGNDAAYILANAIAGSTEEFVSMMNDKAAELGMEDTFYVNPTGTEAEGAYTSANDVVTVSLYAYSMTKYLELSDSPSVSLNATNMNGIRTVYNRNYFVSNYYNLDYLDYSVMGLNAGMSTSAGWCLSVIGRSESGLTYIIAVMGGVDPEEESESAGEEDSDESDKSVKRSKYFVSGYEDAEMLLNWAYDNFGYFTIIDTSEMVCEVPVKLSSKVDHVVLLPEEKLVSFLPLDTDIESVVETEWKLTNDTLRAPLSQGEAVGVLTVYMDDEVLGEVNLVARNNVERDRGLLVLDTVVSFLTHPLVIFIGVLLLLAIIAYVVLMAKYLARKRQVVKYRRRK